MAKNDERTAPGLAANLTAKPPFQAVVLVCRECEDRKDGPEHLDSRQVRKGLKHALRDQRPKARIVESSCLGTCPKKALMVAAMRSGQAIRGVGVQPSDDLAQIALVLGAAS
jgi:predicted metal-binding protein